MRRLAVIPLALLLGCWDFDSLSGTYVPPIVDASAPGDIACAKTPNTLQEDCTQNGDINNNCLYGCDDPTCNDHVACFASKGFKTYGAVKPTAGACPTQSTSSTIYQNIVTPANCNGNCSCSAGTCSSTLHTYSDNACAMEIANSKFAITEGANKCPAPMQPGPANSYYMLDKLTAGGCAASGSGNLSVNWQTTNVLCDQGASKLVRFTDMKSNGVSCVVFSGTDTSVCASTKVFPQGAVWYTGSSGSSTCACSCTGPTGGCTLGNGEVKLDDQDMCKGMQMTSEIKTAATCSAAAISFQVKGVATNIPAPTCGAPAGVVANAFMATGGFTVCCQ